MKPFRFRLEQVLKLRIRDRDARRGELAQAQQAAEVLRGQMNDLRVEIESIRARTVANTRPGLVNVDRLLNSHRFELLLKAQLGELQRRAVQIEAEVQRRRQRLVEADQQVKVLEQLREKQLAEDLRVRLRDEQKGFDELAGRAYWKQNAPP